MGLQPVWLWEPTFPSQYNLGDGGQESCGARPQGRGCRGDLEPPVPEVSAAWLLEAIPRRRAPKNPVELLPRVAVAVLPLSPQRYLSFISLKKPTSHTNNWCHPFACAVGRTRGLFRPTPRVNRMYFGLVSAGRAAARAHGVVCVWLFCCGPGAGLLPVALPYARS